MICCVYTARPPTQAAKKFLRLCPLKEPQTPDSEACGFISSGGRMRASLSALLYFGLIVSILSLSVPAADIPESPYDESETFPYVATPSLLSIVQHKSRIALQATLKSVLPSCLGSFIGRNRISAVQSKQTRHLSKAPAILNGILRC